MWTLKERTAWGRLDHPAPAALGGFRGGGTGGRGNHVRVLQCLRGFLHFCSPGLKPGGPVSGLEASLRLGMRRVPEAQIAACTMLTATECCGLR